MGDFTSYRELKTALLKSGYAVSVQTGVIYESDHWDADQGSEPFIKIKPHLAGDRGAIIGAFCSIDLANGKRVVDICDADYIDSCKACSKRPKQWEQWPTEYAKKAIFKRACKELPELDELRAMHELIARDNSEGFDSAKVQGAKPKTITNAQRKELFTLATEYHGELAEQALRLLMEQAGYASTADVLAEELDRLHAALAEIDEGTIREWMAEVAA